MPEGFIRLPADSTGKSLRTIDRGAAGHDQRVVLAPDERQGTYRAGVTASGATAAANLMSLENPTGSGRSVELTRAFVAITAVAATTAHAYIHLGRTTALPTGGTVQTVQKDRTADAAAVAIPRAAPTATAATGSMRTQTIGWVVGTAYAWSPAILELIDAENNPLVLAPGEAIVVRTDGANDADYRFAINVAWREV